MGRLQKILDSSRRILLEDTHVNVEITATLLQNDVITGDESEEILAENTSKKRANKLMDIVRRKGDEKLEIFIQSLREAYHEHVADHLTEKLNSLTQSQTEENIEPTHHHATTDLVGGASSLSLDITQNNQDEVGNNMRSLRIDDVDDDDDVDARLAVTSSERTVEQSISTSSIDQSDEEVYPISNGRFTKDYENLGKLGEGSYGVVFKTRHRIDNSKYAIKIVPRSNMSEREIKQLSRLYNIDHIVRYFDCWCEDDAYDVNSKKLFIKMELCDGSLKDWFMSHSRHRERSDQHRMICELAEGVEYIHKENIMHRDIKPDNILLLRGTVKISDFGCVKEFDQCATHTSGVGNYLYKSPEQMRGNRRNYGKEVDIYASGLITYEMFNPCLASQTAEVLAMATDKEYPVSFEQNHPKIRDLVTDMLEENPASRIAAEVFCKRIHDIRSKWIEETTTQTEAGEETSLLL